MWLKWIVPAVAVVVVLAAALVAYGRWRWARSTDALVARLEAARVATDVTRYDSARELAAVPAPVRRYFQSVLTEAQSIVTAATVDHIGTFNMSDAGHAWKPFSSRQRVVTRRPGFVWDGRVTALPGINVHVHDAYVAGEGILHPAVMGLVTLFDLRGPGDVAQGELMRFLAEAAWYPTALLPSQGVRWAPIDDRSARATLVDGDLSLTLSFVFSADGPIESVRAEARGRTVGKTIVPTPWEGRWSNLQWRDGMLVPLTGEVAWLTPEGRKPYWRGTITALRYEMAP